MKYVCIYETLRKYVAYCGLGAEANHYIQRKIINDSENKLHAFIKFLVHYFIIISLKSCNFKYICECDRIF